MKKIKVKKLETKEISGFLRFAKDFITNRYLDYPKWLRDFYWHREFSEEKFNNSIKKEERVVFIAKDGKQIVGFSFLKLDFGGSADLKWLGISEKYRNQGIGSSLLDMAEEYALSKKRHFICLYTESQKNIKFYKKRKYQLIGLLKKSWFGQNEYLLQKSLSKPDYKRLRKEAKIKK